MRKENFAVGWVCALHHELAASRGMLDEEYDFVEGIDERDYNVYTLGRIGSHNVVMACLPAGRYGTESAATVANDMVRTFSSIRFGLMVGIGGGAATKQNDVRLGDVVVSKPVGSHGGVVQYDFGKMNADGTFKRRGILNKPPLVLLNAIQKLQCTHSMRDPLILNNIKQMTEKFPRMSIEYSRPAASEGVLHGSACAHAALAASDNCDRCCEIDRVPRLDDQPHIHYGLIASGNKVIANAQERDRLLLEEPEILCFETEAAGLMDSFPCLVIRGICDYADAYKCDTWQKYAAATAAAYAKELLETIHPVRVDAAETAATITNMIVQQEEETRTMMKRLRQEDHDGAEFDRLLQSLGFPTMHTRQEAINYPYPDTFAWLLNPHPDLQKSISNFIEWSQAGTGLHWISGKPGSGKSTLMKYLKDHADLRRLLEEWSGADKLITATFFFWRAGTTDQRSIHGLLRSLLHQLILQHPPLAQLVMSSKRRGDHDWSIERLLASLRAISERCKQDSVKVFLLIDGLDEFERDGVDQRPLVDLILELVNNVRVKALVSSRPEPLFSNRLAQYGSLRLQDLTFDDIAKYVRGELAKEATISQYSVSKTCDFSNLAEFVAKKADGVFLWAHIATQDLLEGILGKDSADMLEQRLSGLNRDINALFDQLLQRISRVHRARAADYLHFEQIWHATADGIQLTVLDMAFACEPDLGRAVYDLVLEVEKGSAWQAGYEECVQRLHDFGSSLHSRCAGLLDVNNACRTNVRRGRFEYKEVINFKEVSESAHLSKLAYHLLKYEHYTCLRLVHRSAWDFLRESPKGMEFLSGATMSLVDRQAGLSRAYDGAAMVGLFVLQDLVRSTAEMIFDRPDKSRLETKSRAVKYMALKSFLSFFRDNGNLPTRTARDLPLHLPSSKSLDVTSRWLTMGLDRMARVLEQQQVTREWQNPDERQWKHTGLYLLGDLPASHLRLYMMLCRRNVAYVMDKISEEHMISFAYLFDGALWALSELAENAAAQSVVPRQQDFEHDLESLYPHSSAMRTQDMADCIKLIRRLLDFGMDPNMDFVETRPIIDDNSLLFPDVSGTVWLRYTYWLCVNWKNIRRVKDVRDSQGNLENLSALTLGLARDFLRYGAECKTTYTASSRSMLVKAQKGNLRGCLYLNITTSQDFMLEVFKDQEATACAELDELFRKAGATRVFRIDELALNFPASQAHKEDKKDLINPSISLDVFRDCKDEEQAELSGLAKAHLVSVLRDWKSEYGSLLKLTEAAIRIWNGNLQQLRMTTLPLASTTPVTPELAESYEPEGFERFVLIEGWDCSQWIDS